jgi:hypothetical protein
VYRWTGGALAQRDAAVPADRLERVLALPYGEGVDHPEGMTLFHDKLGAGDELLVVYDSASPARQIGESTVLADVFALPRPKKRKG